MLYFQLNITTVYLHCQYHEDNHQVKENSQCKAFKAKTWQRKGGHRPLMHPLIQPKPPNKIIYLPILHQKKFLLFLNYDGWQEDHLDRNDVGRESGDLHVVFLTIFIFSFLYFLHFSFFTLLQSFIIFWLFPQGGARLCENSCGGNCLSTHWWVKSWNVQNRIESCCSFTSKRITLKALCNSYWSTCLLTFCISIIYFSLQQTHWFVGSSVVNVQKRWLIRQWVSDSQTSCSNDLQNP